MALVIILGRGDLISGVDLLDEGVPLPPPPPPPAAVADGTLIRSGGVSVFLLALLGEATFLLPNRALNIELLCFSDTELLLWILVVRIRGGRVVEDCSASDDATLASSG